MDQGHWMPSGGEGFGRIGDVGVERLLGNMYRDTYD